MRWEIPNHVGTSDAGHSAISPGRRRVASPPAIARKIRPATARERRAALLISVCQAVGPACCWQHPPLSGPSTGMALTFWRPAKFAPRAQCAFGQLDAPGEDLQAEHERPGGAELSQEAEGIAVPVVFENPAVLGEAADCYAAKRDRPPVVASFEHPPGGDAIGVAHLFLDLDLQASKDRPVERDGFAGAVVTMEDHAIDVIYKVRVVVAVHTGEVARADNLDGLSCLCDVVVLRICSHADQHTRQKCSSMLRMAGRPKKTSSGLAPLESKVMEAVWDAAGPVTVRDVLEALNASRADPLAYTTVMTVMNRLLAKDILARSGQPRHYLYEATASDPAGIAVREAIRIHGDAAVAYFVQEAQADPELWSRLRSLVGGDR